MSGIEAILKFDLTDIDASHRHKTCINAQDMASDLFDIYNMVKGRLKHNENVTEEERRFLEEIMEITGNWTDKLAI